jgi:hypothetical protein
MSFQELLGADIGLMVYLQNQSYDSNKLVVRVCSKGWENLFLLATYSSNIT